MKCPKCDAENADSAKFCKKCGAQLKSKEYTHGSMMDSMNKTDNNNTTKIIIVALIVVALVLAGALAYIYGGFGNNQASDNTHASNDAGSSSVKQDDDDNDEVQATQTGSSQSSKPASSSSMSIKGGSFSTGSELEDKTYASIFVGPEHAGESVTVQIFYSRDGSTLNNGNMVPVTVDSSGYIEVASADAYSYFPDHADVKLYSPSGDVMDTKSVSLSPSSGTQSF